MLLAAAYAAWAECPTCAANVSTAASPPTASAETSTGGYTIEKKAASRISLGEILTVQITIKNDYPVNLSVELKEYIGGAEAVDLGGFARSTPKGSPIPPYYKKSLQVAPKSEATVSYSIKPLYHGTLIIPETEAVTNKGNQVSNMLVVDVECNKNGRCDLALAENAITCPQDCPADKPDGLCNPRKDSACDPDCQGGDPDCGAPATTMPLRATTTTVPDPCGNKVCESPKENYKTCPADCASGQMDGYCDKVPDTLCDPDCSSGEDPDCQGPGATAIVIAILFVVVLILLFAHKKGWLKREE